MLRHTSPGEELRQALQNVIGPEVSCSPQSQALPRELVDQGQDLHLPTILGTDEDGRTSLVRTRGNPGSHIVLRGGGAGKTNYDAASVAAACALLRQADLEEVVVIDCSHGNSGRKHERQRAVWNDVVARRAAGRRELAGAMVESNLHEGSQKMVSGDGAQLRYGVSVIDECVGWDTTEAMLRDAAEALARGRVM
jgi:3-deoxy-7-phosphoheptulonate synthase